MTEKQPSKDRMAIVGLGKVGTAVGYLLKSAAMKLRPSSIRNPMRWRSISLTRAAGRPKALRKQLRMGYRADYRKRRSHCDRLQDYRAGRRTEGGQQGGSHGSAGGLDFLSAAREFGCRAASIHPIQSFADVDGAIANIPGSTFGVTAEDEIRDWAVALVKDLKGIPLFITEKDKPLYHAAACMASNYLTTLIHTVETIYHHFGLDSKQAVNAFWPLINGTLKNIEAQGTVQALTGPIARGDVETIRKHVRSLSRESFPTFSEAYCIMGELTIGSPLRKKACPKMGRPRS